MLFECYPAMFPAVFQGLNIPSRLQFFANTTKFNIPIC